MGVCFHGKRAGKGLLVPQQSTGHRLARTRGEKEVVVLGDTEFVQAAFNSSKGHVQRALQLRVE